MKRLIPLLFAVSLLLTGCNLQSDPPVLGDLPRYDSRIVLDSGDFQDNLWYYEYSFESYSAEEMANYLQKATRLHPLTEEDQSTFYGVQHHFDQMLGFHALYGTATELVDTYFDDEFHVTKSFPLDDEDWFCDSDYGVFLYDTQSQTLYGLNA